MGYQLELYSLQGLEFFLHHVHNSSQAHSASYHGHSGLAGGKVLNL
jgi:hypothetical protein